MGSNSFGERKRMKKFLSFAVLGSLVLASSSAHAEHTRVTNPNGVGVEILGRNLLYGIFYDHVVSDDIAAGFGFGTVPTKRLIHTGDGDAAIMVPAYMNFYLFRDQNSPFGTAGVTLIPNADNIKDSKTTVGGLKFMDSAVMPVIGLGWESRMDSGFLFRFSAYGLIGESFAPWAGFSFGYSF